MKDRETEIKEMSEIIYQNACNQITICGTCHYGKKNGEFVDCVAPTIAQRLYDAGYRKMDDITLKLDLRDRSAEEINAILEQLKSAIEKDKPIVVANTAEEIRKQTAKEIFDSLLEQCKGQGDICYEIDIINLAKLYGVEIDE